MKPEETYLLELVRSINQATEIPQVPKGLWPEVKSELLHQTILCFPADSIFLMGLTAAEQTEYLSDIGASVSSWHRYMQVHHEVLRAILGADVAVVFIKGAASALQYRRPEHRSMGDIDLLVKPSDFRLACKALNEDGWRVKDDSGIDPRNISLKKPGKPTIELHNRFASSSSPECGRRLDEMLYAGIDNFEIRDVLGYSVLMLPTLENGLVLLAHMNHHANGSLGLRHLLDWQMYVAQYLDDDYWGTTFGPAARAIGFEKLAKTATLACKRWLGLESASATGLTWCDDVDSEVADELLLFVLAKGNMGRKQPDLEKPLKSTLWELSSPARAIKYLYAGGKVHWAPARRHPILAPAACAYQIGHIVRKGLKRQTSLGEMRAAIEHSSADADFLERIGATRM